MKQVILHKYNNSWFSAGAGKIKIALWYLFSIIFFKNSLLPFYGVKSSVLRLFGATVGKGLVIKPCVNIKYPWNLEIGDDVWIGENVWIDNLVKVRIDNNAVLSQGCLLLCGNHNYKTTTFDLIVKGINIEEGAWIGAKAIVCQGVTVGSHAVLCVGSVTSHNLEPYSIYQGNPAQKIRERVIT